MNPDAQMTAATDRAQAPGGIVDQSWVWIEANWLHLMAGAPSIVLTLITVDILKGWLKLYMAGKLGERYTTAIEDLAVRTLTLLPAFCWCAILDFPESLHAMTGHDLGWAGAMAVGTFSTAGLALFVVWLGVAETVRVRFQRITKVTKADIESARTRKHAPIPGDLSDLRKDSDK